MAEPAQPVAAPSARTITVKSGPMSGTPPAGAARGPWPQSSKPTRTSCDDMRTLLANVRVAVACVRATNANWA